MEQKIETKKEYEKPKVESEELYERTALACSGSTYYNYRYNLKDNSGSCGYSDS
ncbi:MAG: hypothetical protein QGH93_00470 [Gammaproteobacteria bacterium]|jgi:hypothetical protein|nr:hypothetical protein [Gammaproteobacteria bacterium]|tara:strand:- start:5889 stop:6050 length:162 start_codon:yes stop_codon:yes gene_type:complete